MGLSTLHSRVSINGVALSAVRTQAATRDRESARQSRERKLQVRRQLVAKEIQEEAWLSEQETVLQVEVLRLEAEQRVLEAQVSPRPKCCIPFCQLSTGFLSLCRLSTLCARLRTARSQMK
jgi:hypothetical protein